jgi:glycosyltransferase involved in cell wall biosynthesis
MEILLKEPKTNMRVYYINSGLQGCYFVRCLLPLQSNGWDGDQTSINLDQKLAEDKSIAAQKSDVVVFHRPDDPDKLKIAQLLRGIGKKIVFDNDDTFKDDGGFKFNEFMNEERLKKGLETINDTIDKFIKMADLVTCSTEFLKKEYEKLNPNVVVLPNCIDPFYFDEPLKNETNKVRIGIVGSTVITSDFEVAKPILNHFKDREDVTFVLFSMPPNKHDKITRELYYEEYKYLDELLTWKNIEWQPFVDNQDYYSVLNELRLDMVLIPRADNYFNRCKSNLKFLEMSMLEIPCIAQGFPDKQSPYEVDPEDSEHMIIVSDNDFWIPEVESLIKDRDRRVKIGKEAREYVINKYDIEKNAHLWEEAYLSMYKK